MLSDGIKNVVDELTVSHHFAEYNNSRADDSFYSGKWGGGNSGSAGERSGGYFIAEQLTMVRLDLAEHLLVNWLAFRSVYSIRSS